MPGGLSIVMPAYNARDWIEPTLARLRIACERAGLSDYEIVIVDDGSTDGTSDEVRRLAAADPRIRLVAQANAGRFVARREGVKVATYGRILFVDTRVWVDPDAIAALVKQLATHPERRIWNGHINVAKKGNVIARFGDAITCIGWRRYFKAPRLTSYGVADFDHYPKGTGLFTAETGAIRDAMTWFESATTDLRNSSDDTLLIRHLAESDRIWLSPEFSATYFARTSLRAFVTHSYNRGQYFVDGFLRPGTRFRTPLIAFLVGSPLLIAGVVVYPPLLIAVAMGWVLELAVALALGIDPRDALSLWVLTPLFAACYGAGIWQAFLRRLTRRLKPER